MTNNNTKTVVVFTAFAVATTLASLPRAQAQAAQAADPSDPAETVSAAPASLAARGTAGDPNIDRGFLLPTAMTQPAGSITYNNYELLLHGVTYGITDRVQASVTVLSPIVSGMPFVGYAAVKGQIVSTDRFHLALQGSFGGGHITILDSGSNFYSAGAGVIASACLRADCSSLLSASATYQVGLDDLSSFSERLDTLIYGASVVHRVGQHVKLLAEVTSAAGSAGTSGTFQNADGVLVGYGVRFNSNDIAADVGFARPFGASVDSQFIMGLPFVNVSYRWQ
jgi:hypothetical protein